MAVLGARRRPPTTFRKAPTTFPTTSFETGCNGWIVRELGSQCFRLVRNDRKRLDPGRFVFISVGSAVQVCPSAPKISCSLRPAVVLTDRALRQKDANSDQEGQRPPDEWASPDLVNETKIHQGPGASRKYFYFSSNLKLILTINFNI